MLKYLLLIMFLIVSCDDSNDVYYEYQLDLHNKTNKDFYVLINSQNNGTIGHESKSYELYQGYNIVEIMYYNEQYETYLLDTDKNKYFERTIE